MKHTHSPATPVPGRYLAFSDIQIPVVFWNITNRCNLNCLHCYSNSDRSSEIDDELTTSEGLSLIDDLAAMGVPLILFTGGEPLMREDIWELADHAYAKGIKTALSTNGTLINADVACKIRDSRIRYAGISLDGANAETHDRFRNFSGSFSRSVNAFTRCREAGVRCGVRVTLTRDNFNELEALVDLALDLGVSRFCLYWLVPSGRGIEAYERLQIGQSEAEEALNILYQKAKKTDPATMEFLTVDAPQDCIHLLRSMERDGSPDLDDARKLIRSMNGGCSAGNRVANIDQLGNVYPCQFARSPDLLVGNIREQKFSKIWVDEKNPVLSMFRNKTIKDGGKCSKCIYLDLCGGGCRVRAYAASGDFSADDPFCFIEDVNDKTNN